MKIGVETKNEIQKELNKSEKGVREANICLLWEENINFRMEGGIGFLNRNIDNRFICNITLNSLILLVFYPLMFTVPFLRSTNLREKIQHLFIL